MDTESFAILEWYLGYSIIPIIIFVFTLWINKNITIWEKISKFIIMNIIILTYYSIYLNQWEKIDCILSYFNEKELYPQDYVEKYCLNEPLIFYK